MLQKGDSIGVFQVESRAQMSMLPRLKPETFYDLVVEVAIVRPGPIQGGMVHPYLKRRSERRAALEKGLPYEIDYPSPSPRHGPADELKQVLHKTLGVPLFQEQAMRIAMEAAKYTPAEANSLRRAMATFRHMGTIGEHEERFVSRMIDRGYDPDFARSYTPPISSLRVDVDVAAEQSVALLLNRVQHRDLSPPRSVKVASDFILRQSCGPAPKD